MYANISATLLNPGCISITWGSMTWLMFRPHPRAAELESLDMGPGLGIFEVLWVMVMCSQDSVTHRLGETQELKANLTDFNFAESFSERVTVSFSGLFENFQIVGE